MFRNYLLVTLRNLKKQLSYSIINVVGLGLGLAICLLLTIWTKNELSYDRFHDKSDRIYRASLEYSFGGQTAKTSVSPTALLPVLQKNFPEVENGVRLYNPASFNPYIIRKNEKLFQEERFYFADSTFFEIFSFHLIEGDPHKALVNPQSVILSQAMAKKYFGEEDPIGKALQINNGADYIITGIIEDAPENSLLQFDFLASFSSLDASKEQIWWSANYQTFLLLAPNTNLVSLSEKTNALIKKELSSELTNENDYVKYNLMRLTDIYLKSDTNNEPEIIGSIDYVYGFGTMGLLILIIACINYINLATAKATDRAKEIGIRKVVGAEKRQLFFQFIGESIVITLLAFGLAFLMAQLALPLFNSLTGKHFTAALISAPLFLLYCFAAILVIGFVAGVYPALAITAFKPIRVLKGNFKSSGKGIWLRKSLVVFQFGATIVLIVGTIVILKQLHYVQNTRLGYSKENVIILPLDKKMGPSYDQLRTEFLRSGKVLQLGRATESPTKIGGGYSINITGQEHGMVVTAMCADTTFIPTMGMEFIAGRNFTEGDFQRLRSDTAISFILNESAIHELSIDAEKAIGTSVNLNGRKGEIVGLLKDFHFASLHQAIGPLVLFNEEDQLNFLFVRIKTDDIKSTLSELKTIYNNVIPHRPFEYEFLDEQYEALYSSEQRMSKISIAFAVFAILIACLGLLGLVAFSASQKTKEISIRKVMGASAPGIVILITRDYVRLVFIAIMIGLPLAYWIIEKWFLNSFVYKTTIGPWPLIIASISCFLIAFLTSSYQAIKAAFINPAETLRNE